jgi:hypothetical protein
MRLITGISIATLAVSVTALALVLWLVVTEPWESDVQSANEEHTPELDADAVKILINEHAAQLIKSEGLTHEDGPEEFERIPGYRCFWENKYWEAMQIYTGLPETLGSDSPFLNYNYIEIDDIWLVTSVYVDCKNNYETWTIDDNTGAITYGRLP